jgi:superfamily II DNA helicase RecQ
LIDAVFTSPEIVTSTPFNTDVLRNPTFRQRLTVVCIDELHLTEEWKSFRPQYGCLGALRGLVPESVPWLGVSATLPDRLLAKIRPTLGFNLDTRLIRVDLDRPEITIMARQLQKPAKSCLDLSPLLPKRGTDPYDIPKTIVFMESISKIRSGVETVRHLLRDLGFSKKTANQTVQPYFSEMSERDKKRISDEFRKPASHPTQSMRTSIRILIVTDSRLWVRHS